MGVVRTMVTTLFLSAWLVVHAVFLANLPPEQEVLDKKLLPLQIPSVFHMPWFRTLMSNHMNVEKLRFTPSALPEQQPASSVWTSIFAGSGVSSAGRRGARLVSYSSRSSSKASPGAAASLPDRYEEDWFRPLSWAVTAMTMAEWLTFSGLGLPRYIETWFISSALGGLTSCHNRRYFVWRILWLTILRPIVVVVSVILLLLICFYCIKGYYYALGASSLSPEHFSAVLPYITAVDEFLHAAGKELMSWNGRVLDGLDQLLSAVFTPAAVLERQQHDKQQLLLGKKQQNASNAMTLPAAVFDILRNVQLLVTGGSFEGNISGTARSSAGGGDL